MFHRPVRFLTMLASSLSLVLSGCASPPGPPSNAPVAEVTQSAGAAAEFDGVIGRTLAESQPSWPQRPSAPEGAPNVLVWLLDDAGYAHLEPFGGQARTPNLAKLASRGLVFSNFHSIPLCSPARAALLTARNHHTVGMGSHIMSPAGFPGYNGHIPPSAKSWVRVLKDNGYATYAFGKWDQTPVTEASVAGPFDSWPSGQGFDRFYGFIGGEAHHFHPGLWSDHTPISPADGREDYFLTTDLADKAIEYVGGLRANAPAKPFMLYWSTGAVHAPHHAPKEDIEAYAGAFDEGWDVAREQILQRQLELGIVPPGTVLSPRLETVPAWDSLTPTEKKLYARQMEAFAAQMTHADREFGRILDYLEAIGELDNTIVIVTSDNGGSAEGGLAGLHNEALSLNSKAASVESNMRFYEQWGGPETINHFHVGWAMAGNTPLPYFKHHTEGGGTQVPMLISWPRSIDQRGVRPQFHFVTDIGPTILELIGITPPTVIDGVLQKPYDGVSMSYAFDAADRPSERQVQYFEVWGNRAIYKDGWRASTIHNNIMPWQRPVPGNIDDDVWRLYNVAEDFSMSRDLAAVYPEKLAELQTAWEAEAQKYGVYPIDPNRRARFIAQMNKSGRKEPIITYFPEGASRIPEALSPPVKNRSFGIEADIEVGPGIIPEGMIVTSGGITGGYAFYLDQGYPVFAHNLHNEEIFFIRSQSPIQKGASMISFRFDKQPEGNGGTGRLFINGQETGSGIIRETVPNSFSIEEGFDIGRDQGSAITPEYQTPFVFNAEIKAVRFRMDTP